MGNHNSSLRPVKDTTVNDLQEGKPREFWTLDEWDRAFDWDHGRPDEAAAFLRSQYINLDLSYLTTRALRGVGFTALYEAGRVKPMTEVEGPGGMPDTTAITYSINNVKINAIVFEERRSNPERTSPLTTFSQAKRGQTTFHVQPCHARKGLMHAIRARGGVHYLASCCIEMRLELGTFWLGMPGTLWQLGALKEAKEWPGEDGVRLSSHSGS
jgi:hypothetical protein